MPIKKHTATVTVTRDEWVTSDGLRFTDAMRAQKAEVDYAERQYRDALAAVDQIVEKLLPDFTQGERDIITERLRGNEHRLDSIFSNIVYRGDAAQYERNRLFFTNITELQKKELPF